MEWFRNVPNVIRSHSEQNSQESTYSKQNNNNDTSYSGITSVEDKRTKIKRQTSRETNNNTFINRSFQPQILSMPSKTTSRNDNLICALCGEMFTDPRLLPCLHSFCKRCLEHTVNPRSTTLTCHLCRKEIFLKINGISEFPPNFVLNNLIDIEAVQNSTSKPMLCSSCNEQLPATARCLDCMDFLCYACHNAHSRVRMTKDHQILTLEQLKRSDEISNMLHRPVYCQSHKEEKVSYYCKTCEQTICRECVITSHQQSQHDYLPIEQAVRVQKDEIMSLKNIIEQKLPMINRLTSQLHETQQKLDSRSDLIKSEILDRTPRLMKLLEQKEAEILQDLDSIIKEKKGILLKQLNSLQAESKSLEAVQKFTEQAMNTGTDDEILTLKSILCGKLKEAVQKDFTLDAQVDDQISCNTNIEAITSAIHSYGQLSTSGEEFLNCSILGDVATAIKGQMSQLTLVIKNQHGKDAICNKEDIDAELTTPEFGVLVPDIRTKSDSTFSLVYRTYSVGTHKLSIKLRGKHITGSPFAVNVISSQDDNNVKAPPSDRHLSNTLRKDDNELKLAKNVKTLVQRDHNEPSSPVKLSNNDIIKENASLEIFAQPKSTSEVQNIANEDDKTKSNFLFAIGRRGTQFGEFHGVFGVACDSLNKRIIATDCHNNRIQIFSEEGKFLFSFGQKGFNDGEFQNPTGVGVGPNGEIVVCERLKGRIQVFDSQGVFQRRFILNQLKASTLSVDVAGRIIIADYTNCCIYILDPILERWSKFGHFGQGEGELQYPCYVATDNKGNIYVSDMNSNKVQMYDSDSTFIRNFGTRGDKDGQFLHPTGVAIDNNGNVIVADRDNHRIQIMSPKSEFLYKFGAKGDDEGALNDTHGLAVLSNGTLAAADLKNNQIQIFSMEML